ncbi:fungal zn(2)-Cys(6) binuclear cluster domain-containing protein [Rhizoctonia solani AG-1 IA]|uniref:Fungal zn(2)-Cys(6) binuclear cluster domain-containing protein n=1 Tax=Thanatephorus cucumeris (strain AG1-IA) TaxID=983506 RepID=L8WLV7_THACA|nr:fungal zn(2)-Cys(6) binuclear cluster domain-containing protein [Rhizoctonia solani AG-1 IA]
MVVIDQTVAFVVSNPEPHHSRDSVMSSTSKRRAHHATKACNSCRRRRCKCDGVHPVCGTCTFYVRIWPRGNANVAWPRQFENTNPTQCTWSQEEDARRPATKQLVESLRVRIRELEAEVAQLRPVHNPDTMRASLVPSSASSDGAQPEPQPEFPGQSHLTASQLHQLTIKGFVAHLIDRCKKETLAPVAPHPCGLLSPQTICHPHSVFRTILTLINMSSNATQIRPLTFSPVPPNFLTNVNGGETYVCRNSTQLQSLIVWKPEHFLRDMLVQLTPGYPDPHPHEARALSYSPFLHCALMSFATAFSDKPIVKAKETRAHFASCAKQHLEKECDRPTITVVQALTFLSDYHASLGERGLAYLYFGVYYI